jgi:hypothetical protein
MWLNITLGGSLIGYGPLAVLDAVLGLDPIGALRSSDDRTTCVPDLVSTFAGDTWSLQSAQSLLMGVAASAPLVLITAASWMPAVKRQVPLFEEFHEAQVWALNRHQPVALVACTPPQRSAGALDHSASPDRKHLHTLLGVAHGACIVHASAFHAAEGRRPRSSNQIPGCCH